MLDFSRLGMTVDTSQVRSARGDVKGFSQDTKRASGEVETATGKMSKSFGLVKTAVGLTLAAVVALAGSVGTLVRFERSIAQVGAISRATASDLAAMRDIATQLGSTTEFSASQAAGGLRFLAQAGFSARESVAALPAVLDLATAAQMGLAESADIASNIMSGFGIAATDTAAVTDILAATASRANTDVSQLGQAMKFVAPVASGLGISMSDTASAIGKLSDAGIQGGQAGTSLRKIMLSLAAPTDAARDAIQGLGIAASAIDPNLVSLTEIVDQFRDANLDAASGAAIFGQEAVSAMLALTSQADGLRELTGELQNVDGAAADMANAMRDDLRGDVDGLKSALEGLVIALGDAGLTAALRSIVKGITAFVSVISGGINFISKFTSELVTVGTTTDQMNAAIFSVNGQIAGEIALMSELFGELPAGTRLTRDAAQAKLDQASAIRARILQGQAELEQVAKESQAYKQLQNHMAAIQQLIQDAELDRATNAGTLVEPLISDADLQGLREALTQTQAEMTKLVITAGQLPPEYDAATTRMEQLQAALDAAGDGMVVIKDETERAASVSEQLRAILATLPGYTQQAGEGANFLTRALGGAANAALSVFSAVRSVISLLAPLGAGLTSLSNVASTAVKVTGAVGQLFGTVINSDAMKAGIKHLKDAATNVSVMASNAVRAEVATAKLNSSLAGGGGGGGGTADAADKVKTATEGFNEAMQEAALTAEELGTKTANILISGVDGIADAFGDFIVGGLKDFKGFAKSILSSFTSMISQMISMAAKNRIMIGLGVSGGAGIAQAATNGGSGGGGGLTSGLLSNAIGSFGEAGSGIFGALGGGTGFLGGLGNALSGGLANVLNIGANAAAAGGGFMASLGAAAPVLAGIAAAISFFRKKVTNLDAGIRLATDGLDSMIETYKVLETSRFWGLSKKISTTLEAATADVADPLQKAVAQVQAGVIAQTQALGMSASIYDDFTRQIDISTKGLTEDQAAAKVQEALDEIAYSMANIAVQSTGLVDVYENSANILADLAGSLTGVNNAMGLLKLTTFDVSLAGGVAAASFTKLFGGLDAFNQISTAYYQTYYSEAERLSDATAQLTDQMAALYLAVPQSKEEFRKLIETFDAMGDVDTVAKLMQIAPMFAEVAEASGWAASNAERLAAAQAGVTEAQTALTAAFSAYETAVNAEIASLTAEASARIAPLQAEIDAAQTSTDAAVDILKSAMSSLRSLTEAEIKRQQDLAEQAIAPLAAQIEILDEAATSAASGVEDAYDALVGLIDAQRSDIIAGAEAEIEALNAALGLTQGNADQARSDLEALGAQIETLASGQIAALEASAASAIAALTNGLASAAQGATDARTAAEDAYASFTGFIEGQKDELTTAAQEMTDTLIAGLDAARASVDGLRTTFDRTFDALEGRLSGRSDSLSQMLNILLSRTQGALDASAAALSEIVSGLQGFATSIDGLLNQRSPQSEAGTIRNYQTAQRDLAAMLAGGSVTDSGLQSVIQGLGNDSTKGFSDRTAYLRDFNKTNADLAKLRDQQLAAAAEAEANSPEAQQVNLLQAQLDAISAAMNADEAHALEQLTALGAIVSASEIEQMIANGQAAELVGINAGIAQQLLSDKTAVDAELAQARETYQATVDQVAGLAEVNGTLQGLNDASAALLAANADLQTLETETTNAIATIDATLAAEIAVLDDQLAQADVIAKNILDVKDAVETLAQLQAAMTTFDQAQAHYAWQASSAAEQIAAIETARDEQIAAIQASTDAAQAQIAAVLGVGQGIDSLEALLGQAATKADEYAALEAQLVAQEVSTASQISAIETARDAQLQTLTHLAETALADYQASLGIEAGITTVSDGVAALAAAVEANRIAQEALVTEGAAHQAEIDAIQTASDTEIARLNALLLAAEDQYNTALGISGELTAIDEQLAAFNSALAGYSDAQTTLSGIIEQNQPIIDQINATLDAEITALTDQLEAFRTEVAPISDLPDALTNLQTAITGLSDAQAALVTAIDLMNAPVETTEPTDLLTSQLQGVYQATLQREADQAGLSYYTGQVLGGRGLDDIQRELATSQEYRNNIFNPFLSDTYQNALGRAVDQAGADHYWQEYLSGVSAAAIANSIHSSPEALGVPGFASGGAHMGGWRIVGENGPELENTGPSRIYSNPQTRDLFDANGIINAINDLKAEVVDLRNENTQLQMAIQRNTQVSAEEAERARVVGQKVTVEGTVSTQEVA